MLGGAVDQMFTGGGDQVEWQVQALADLGGFGNKITVNRNEACTGLSCKLARFLILMTLYLILLLQLQFFEFHWFLLLSYKA